MTTTFQHSANGNQVTWEVINSQPVVNLTHRDNCRKVATLARHLIKNEVCNNLSDAMAVAWNYVKGDQDLTFVSFKTVSGQIKNRVVYTNVSEYYTPTGTGRPTKPGQTLFVDFAKWLCGEKSFIISTYNIIEQF